MDNENVTQVPYIVYESEQSRNERTRQEMQKFITKMESMM